MDAVDIWSHPGVAGRSATIKAYLQRFGIHIFLIAFACIYYVSNGNLMIGHYDLGWHLAAGDVIREHGAVPLRDPWSFTHGDKQWFNLSWLWDVLASVLYQYSGFAGLVLSVVACGAVIVGYLASLCLNRGVSATATCISVFLVCLLYPSFVTRPNIYLAAAPNTATMVFAVLFYGECLKRTRWVTFPLMMALWVNLHGGFPIGFFLIGVFGAMALLRRDWPGVRFYALAGVTSLAAIFVNPLGWHIYDGVTATLGNFVQANITEWQSFYLNMSLPGSYPSIVYMLLFVALELLGRRAAPIPAETRLLSWLFLGLGLYQFRYLSFFFLFSALPIALHLEGLLPQRFKDHPEIRKALLAAGLAGFCVLPLTFAKTVPALAMPELISQQDADYLRAHFSHARVLNHWNVGGLLIFRTHGAVPLFVDGRAATSYPEDLLRDYFKLVHWEIDESTWDTILQKYRIDAVLWIKGHEQLRHFLVEERGWKEEYVGHDETVYVRPGWVAARP